MTGIIQMARSLPLLGICLKFCKSYFFTFKINFKSDIKEGDELLINYGHEANGDLLSLYGFTIDKNQSPISYSQEELVQACTTTQGLHQRVCEARIEYFTSEGSYFCRHKTLNLVKSSFLVKSI